MQENGVSDDVISETLAEQNNNLDKAIQLEDKAKTDDNLSYGIQMDFVATYLDNAKVQPDLNAAAQTQWTADLFAADATVAELNKQIEDAEFATGVEAEKAKFDAAVEAIAALKAAPTLPQKSTLFWVCRMLFRQHSIRPRKPQTPSRQTATTTRPTRISTTIM